jgi:DNA-directed RNA polymerase subunit RPC12/RpoP
MVMHDDRCPRCNVRVLGFKLPNQSSVIETEKGMFGEQRRCPGCGILLTYSRDIYEPMNEGDTLWHADEVLNCTQDNCDCNEENCPFNKVGLDE